MWRREFSEALKHEVPLAELTTIGIGGLARDLYQPASEDELRRFLAVLSAAGGRHRVLGGGSNLLIRDEAIEEVVIHPAKLSFFEADGTRVRVGAGLPLATLVSRAAELGLAGPHKLAGIPGQLGGALCMNAGGRYGEISELVERVCVVLADGTPETLERDAISYGYRRSEFPPGAVIVSAELRLEAVDDARALRRESGRILKEKNQAQPTRSWSFGCIFKNPPGNSAGILVDQAGCKGLARGAARISPLHGNFIENEGNAKAADVRSLIETARAAVREHAGVELELEVRLW